VGSSPYLMAPLVTVRDNQDHPVLDPTRNDFDLKFKRS
jgi:hypothetical protein